MTIPKHTPGPWELVEATEHHGPYVVSCYGADVADCYAMSDPTAASVRNGGDSYPINLCGEDAHANARLIAAAPEMLEALQGLVEGATAEVNEKGGGGFILARLHEARAAIAKAIGG